MARLVSSRDAAARPLAMRYRLPSFAAIIFAGLAACSEDAPEGQATETAAPTALTQAGMSPLDGTAWQIVSIDGEGVVAKSSATLLLNTDGKLAGNGSCNQYFGSWSMSGGTLNLKPAGATMRACDEALMQQERRLLDALPKVSGFQKATGGHLLLVDSEGMTRVEVAARPAEPQDLPGADAYGFNCADAGRADFRFLGPDTIGLTVAGRSYVMPRERSASGAKYAGDGAGFWNKGDEAMLTIGDETYMCERISG